MRPLAFVRGCDSNEYETVNPIKLDRGIKCNFLPEYKTKKNYHIENLVTSKDIAKWRKRLEISISRAWCNWLKSYVTNQNNIKLSKGTITRPPKIAYIVLLNTLEMGFSKGYYVTGVVIGISVHQNSNNVRSAKNKYRKNNMNLVVTKTLYTIRLIEFDHISDIYIYICVVELYKVTSI